MPIRPPVPPNKPSDKSKLGSAITVQPHDADHLIWAETSIRRQGFIFTHNALSLRSHGSQWVITLQRTTYDTEKVQNMWKESDPYFHWTKPWVSFLCSVMWALTVAPHLQRYTAHTVTSIDLCNLSPSTFKNQFPAVTNISFGWWLAKYNGSWLDPQAQCLTGLRQMAGDLTSGLSYTLKRLQVLWGTVKMQPPIMGSLHTEVVL